MFKLYTQEDCPNCTSIKEFMKLNNMEYEEIDVNNNTKARAFMIMNDLEATPAIVADSKIIYGDVDSMKAELGQML